MNQPGNGLDDEAGRHLSPGENDVAAPKGFTVHRLKGFPLGVSSSEIRDRVRAGLPVDYLTGKAVAEVIRDNGLYL